MKHLVETLNPMQYLLIQYFLYRSSLALPLGIERHYPFYLGST